MIKSGLSTCFIVHVHKDHADLNLSIDIDTRDSPFALVLSIQTKDWSPLASYNNGIRRLCLNRRKISLVQNNCGKCQVECWSKRITEYRLRGFKLWWTILHCPILVSYLVIMCNKCLFQSYSIQMNRLYVPNITPFLLRFWSHRLRLSWQLLSGRRAETSPFWYEQLTEQNWVRYVFQ